MSISYLLHSANRVLTGKWKFSRKNGAFCNSNKAKKKLDRMDSTQVLRDKEG
jgi:hypothetical protein